MLVFDAKSEFHVGRRINNDITISDISVSRQQASIRLKDGKIFVDDASSKFGTFVRVRGLHRVKPGSKIPI